MRRERNGTNLAVAREAHRELQLLDGRDVPLRLRNQLLLAKPARRLRGVDEPLRVLRALVVVDAFADRLGAELRDRVTRIDALGTALVAEVAARAVPDSVLSIELVQPLDGSGITRVADEAHPLRQRRRAEELGVGLHRVAFRDAAAAHDAERLLVDHVHLLLRDDAFLLGDLVVAGIEPRLDGADLPPEGIHVDDEVLDHGQIPHRRDHGDVTGLRDVVHPRLAGEHCAAVHAHPARAADHHPAALAVRERPVVTVLDDVEDVQQRRPFGRVHLVFPKRALARLRVVAPDLQGDVQGGLPLIVLETSTVWLLGGNVMFVGAPKSWKYRVRSIVSFWPRTASVNTKCSLRTRPSLPTHASTGNVWKPPRLAMSFRTSA